MPSSVADLVSRHQRIALDSNILIYLLETAGPASDRAADLVDAIESEAVIGVLATVGLVEILSGPARRQDGALFELLATELRGVRNLHTVDLRPEIATDAAWLRGAASLGLEDAIHVATASAAGATAFLTNDRRIRSRRALEVVYLSDLVA